MRKKMMMMLAAILLLVGPAVAAENPVAQEMEAAMKTFAEGCEEELNNHCKDVTPGEGRILACLYAYGDKVSPRCEYALYDSLHQLNRTLAVTSYVIGECRQDLSAYCADVQVGEGRLLDCLDRNKSTISGRCNTALKDAGWK
ncbi:MAG: cysteine rich repeat-containing protein [Desulfofustis sp.]|jgi:hypothetical protein|nr:cysteine rich repeat-containing protein [Desulfofustis sp.]